MREPEAMVKIGGNQRPWSRYKGTRGPGQGMREPEAPVNV